MMESNVIAPAAEDHSAGINTDLWFLLIFFGQYLQKGTFAKGSFSDLSVALIVEIGQSVDL